MSKPIRVYPGAHADVRWDGRLCIHIGECGRSPDKLFESGREPWCQPDLATLDEVQDVVARCPTGALTYEAKGDAAPREVPDDENTVVVSSRGPLYLRGDLHIDGAPGDMPGVRTRAALCRCGQSQNKPFCDNRHEESGFGDRGAVGDGGPGLDGAHGGPLTITPAKNGPLLLAGNVTIVAATGRAAYQGTKAALCRCGESRNKPFCDGSHKAKGFVAD